jgi:hypothetical protein
MRPFYLFLICNLANTQKISKLYTTSRQDEGILYFIEPIQDFKTKKNIVSLFMI